MRQWLQIIKETAVGTTPTADSTNSIWVDMEETDPQINVVPSIYQVRSALPKRGVVTRLSGSGSDDISGSLAIKLYHEQASFWKTAVFEPTLVSTYYTSLPTYTINRAWVDDGYISRVEQYKRCVFSGCTLSGSNAAGSDPITLNLTVMGGEYVDDATLAMPACTVFPVELYLWTMTDFYLNNVSIRDYIRSWSLSITHDIGKRRNMNRYPTSYRHSGWQPSFSVDMDMFSHAYRSKFLDIRTAFDDAIYADNNYLNLTYDTDKEVQFDFYNALFTALDPQRPPNGDHTQAATIVPHYDCTNLDMTCTITNPA